MNRLNVEKAAKRASGKFMVNGDVVVKGRTCGHSLWMGFSEFKNEADVFLENLDKANGVKKRLKSSGRYYRKIK